MASAPSTAMHLALAAGDEIMKAELYDVKFFLLKVKDASVVNGVTTPASKPEGWARLKFNAYYRKSSRKTIIMEVPIISIWTDGRTGDACKVHMLATSASHDEGISDIIKLIKREGALHKSGKMGLSCDRSGIVLRYGVRGDGATYNYLNENYRTIHYFDSKSAALKEAIEEVASGIQIGGLPLINLNSVADGFLEQMGFTKIPDELGVGVPMWTGDVKAIAEAGTKNSYGYGGGMSYEKAQKNRAGFLKLLEDALS